MEVKRLNGDREQSSQSDEESQSAGERVSKNLTLDLSLYRFQGLERSNHGGLAQLEERVLCKHEVIGSSPIFSTIWAGSSAG